MTSQKGLMVEVKEISLLSRVFVLVVEMFEWVESRGEGIDEEGSLGCRSNGS